jgi:hypothetical protein
MRMRLNLAPKHCTREETSSLEMESTAEKEVEHHGAISKES